LGKLFTKRKGGGSGRPFKSPQAAIFWRERREEEKRKKKREEEGIG
jgi:hypothetical protein